MKDVAHIDNHIARLQALLKRLRAERRVPVLREKHRILKFTHDRESFSKGIAP